ncbi:15747_t:CDS:1, partial [Acaulospora colombiana]
MANNEKENSEFPPYTVKRVEHMNLPEKGYLYEMQESTKPAGSNFPDIDSVSSHVESDSEVEDSALLWLNLLGKVYN